MFGIMIFLFACIVYIADTPFEKFLEHIEKLKAFFR